MDSVQQQQLSQAFTGIDISGSARVHLGNAYHINQAAPNRPETPPSPLSTVPFPRDPDFVDRSAILGQVKEKLAVPAARAALVGLGGVGKSQLAIEWSYRKRDESPNTWVLWIHASSAARFEQGVRNVLDQLRVPGRNDTQANVFQLLRNRLYDAKKGNWLVILDNADDASFLLEPATMPCQVQNDQPRERRLDYVPACDHGSLFITSRSRAAALKMVEQKDVIDIGPMEEEHALALLTKKLGDSNEQAEIVRLAQELEYMPLAIVQASAYISHRYPRCTVAQYIDSLAKTEESKLGLLNRDEGDIRRDREAENSIILTWEMSFEHIRTIRRSAADLLSLMSFFDRQAIPAKLLSMQCHAQKVCNKNKIGLENRKYRADKDDASVNTRSMRRSAAKFLSQMKFRQPRLFPAEVPRSRSLNRKESMRRRNAKGEDFEEDLQVLRDYSFVSITAEKDVFEMHRLVQLATQRWLKVDDSFEQWGLQFMINLDVAFPNVDFENWTECQLLFPHAMIACSMKLTEKKSMRKQASILYKSGLYAREKGAYVDAERMVAKSLELHRRVLGDENRDTIASKATLASVYRGLGRYAEAKVLQVQAVESSQRVLGDQHPTTLAVKDDLASLFTLFGEYKEAKELQVEVLEWERRVLGDQDRGTMVTRSNLANLYVELGRYKEAQELHLEVLEWRKRVFGNEHPDTMSTKLQIASSYCRLRKLKDAEKLELEVLEWMKRVLGDEHPNTMRCKNDLAATYSRQGRYTEAEELSASVLKHQRQTFGDEHPSTIMSMDRHAVHVNKLGRHEEAEELLLEALECSIRALGDEHPRTLSRKGNLAHVYLDLGKIEEAKELESEVLERRKILLGEDHPDTILCMANLARVEWVREQQDIAIDLMEQAARLSSLILGDDHHSSIKRYERVAEWSEMRDKKDERNADLSAQMENPKLRRRNSW